MPPLVPTGAVEQRREVAHDDGGGEAEDDVAQQRPSEAEAAPVRRREQPKALGAHADRAGARLHHGVDDEPAEKDQAHDRTPDQQDSDTALEAAGERGADQESAAEHDREAPGDQGVDEVGDGATGDRRDLVGRGLRHEVSLSEDGGVVLFLMVPGSLRTRTAAASFRFWNPFEMAVPPTSERMLSRA
ncbi:hypothetical protein CVS54_00622 [Microbacterium oxydans]|uniref:Uncharacterized protein n=1 Tax=Microbacterium oxydans TaxID=82380 RepID=A0A3S9WGZ2_9MICO|nr:hypothetical protein CVS54_00622 [Microbacterium oxydans]